LSNFFIAFVFQLRGNFIRVYNFNRVKERGVNREGERERQRERQENLANQPLA
jgi:hypothetical protein